MVYYWLTRSVNADIGEACWRRGAFVEFSVTGWNGTGRYVARSAAGVSFGSACTCLSRLVRDTAGGGRDRALLPLRRLILPRFALAILLLFLAPLPFDTPIARLSLRNVVFFFAFFFLSILFRHPKVHARHRGENGDAGVYLANESTGEERATRSR